MRMRKTETYNPLVAELLTGDVIVEVQIPSGLYARLIALGRHRFGNLTKEAIIGKALIYSAAFGTIPWAESYAMPKTRRTRRATYKTTLTPAKAVEVAPSAS